MLNLALLNADIMFDYEKNEPVTSHTTNDTPFILIGAPDGTKVVEGALCDLAPTILELLGEEIVDSFYCIGIYDKYYNTYDSVLFYKVKG